MFSFGNACHYQSGSKSVGMGAWDVVTCTRARVPRRFPDPAAIANTYVPSVVQPVFNVQRVGWPEYFIGHQSSTCGQRAPGYPFLANGLSWSMESEAVLLGRAAVAVGIVIVKVAPRLGLSID